MKPVNAVTDRTNITPYGRFSRAITGLLGAVVLAVLGVWLISKNYQGWEFLAALVAGLVAVQFFHNPRAIFFGLLAFPLVVSEVSNDILFSSTRTPIYAFKVFNLLNLYDLAFFLLLGLWFINALRHKTLRLNRPLDLPMLGFLFVTLLACINGLFFQAQEQRLIFYELINISRFALVYFLTSRFLQGEKDIRRVLALWIVCAALMGGYGLVRFFSGAGVDIYGHGQRILFADPGINTLLMIATLSLMGIWGMRQPWKSRSVLFVLLLPAFASFIFSYRRGMWLGVLAGLWVIWRLAQRQERMTFVKNMGVLIILAVIFMMALRTFQPQVVQSLQYGINRAQSIGTGTQDSSNYYRIIDAQNALESIRHYPVFGLGLGGYYDIFYGQETSHAYQVAKLNNVSHNFYLFLWMKMGVFALFFFLWIIVVTLRLGLSGLTLASPGFRRQAMVFFMAVVITFLVVLLTGPLLLFAGGAVVFGSALAIMDQLATQKPYVGKP